MGASGSADAKGTTTPEKPLTKVPATSATKPRVADPRDPKETKPRSSVDEGTKPSTPEQAPTSFQAGFGLPRAQPVHAKDIARLDQQQQPGEGEGAAGGSANTESPGVNGRGSAWSQAGAQQASPQQQPQQSQVQPQQQQQQQQTQPQQGQLQQPLQQQPWSGAGAPVPQPFGSPLPHAQQAQWGTATALIPPSQLPIPALPGPTPAARVAAEAQLQQRTAQIQAMSRQVEAAQEELRQLRLRSAGTTGLTQAPATMALQAVSRAEQARQAVAIARPEVDAMKEKLTKALKVAKQLNLWFVEHAGNLNIPDPTVTPSAVLERLLGTAEGRAETLATDMMSVEGSLESVVTAHVAASGGVSFQQQHSGVLQAGTPQPPGGDVQPNRLQPTAQGMTVGSQPIAPQQGQSIVVSGVQQLAAVGSQAAMLPAATGQTAEAQQQLLQPMATSSAQPGVQLSSGTHSVVAQQPTEAQASTHIPGSRPGPSPQAAQPGAFGIEGMWVRDPDTVVSQ